jgi:hypothetical protein
MRTNFGWKAGRPRRRCEDNIKMDLEKIGLEDVDWIHLVQDRKQCWALVVHELI